MLTQYATWEEIKTICDDAISYRTASVCIPPSFVKRAKEYVGDRMAVCTVMGFPNGYSTTDVKEYETGDALANGADFIKTSTGFSTAGATFHDVELFAQNVGPDVRIKAAGGISSFAYAERFIELGAERLGTSRIIILAKTEHLF